ncbi:MAG: regulatory protein GemA [Candidatus Competibacteraceae bacterium]
MSDPSRARDLKIIHAARRQMAWDETTYRAILERVAGKASAAILTAMERKAVLDEFARLGWRAKTAKGHRRPGNVPADRAPLMAKVEALLADAGRPWSYADGCARNMFALESIRFCDADQLRRVVAALAYDQKRRAARSPECA